MSAEPDERAPDDPSPSGRPRPGPEAAAVPDDATPYDDAVDLDAREAFAEAGQESDDEARDGEDPAAEAAGGNVLDASVHPGELPDLTESMQLVLEAQKGNRQALNDLLSRYEARILRIVRIKMSARLRRCVETVDIVQDAFANAARAIDTLELRSTASILQWLARIAENQMLDVHRRFYGLKRDRTREVRIGHGRDKDSSHPGVVPVSGGIKPDDQVAKDELRRIVDDGVAQLPDDYREVIMLRTYYGGSWEWVAQQMGRPGADAARQLHRRARIRLSRILRDRVPELPDVGGEP